MRLLAEHDVVTIALLAPLIRVICQVEPGFSFVLIGCINQPTESFARCVTSALRDFDQDTAFLFYQKAANACRKYLFRETNVCLTLAFQNKKQLHVSASLIK